MLWPSPTLRRIITLAPRAAGEPAPSTANPRFVDHHAALFGMIERVLAGATTVTDFESEFYWFYFDQVPEDALSTADREFIESVCEKLDLTAAAPDAESRQHGWVNHAEFRDWLRASYAAHEARDEE